MTQKHKPSMLVHRQMFDEVLAERDRLREALKRLSDWPRNSATVDGKLSGNATVGLANVRRFARAAILKAEGLSRNEVRGKD